MLDWLFAPSCPCDVEAKKWIEERLQWLAHEIPKSAFSGKQVVLPTKEFFPDAYSGSDECVRRIVDRVCGHMDIDPAIVHLKLIKQDHRFEMVDGRGRGIPTGAGGTYRGHRNRAVVEICRSEMCDLIGLVGTTAHELSHHLLLGEGRIVGRPFDNEILTDLTAAHMGFGIFLANGPRNWASQYSKWPNSKLNKPEYMTPPMFGYALAHLAWVRGESKPAWARYLCMSAWTNFKQGLRYLRETKDSKHRLTSDWFDDC